VVGDQAAESLGAQAAREAVERNRRLMRMKTDLAIPDLAGARLPLTMGVVRRALSSRGINFGPSLWALTGGSPPAGPPEPEPDLRPWVFRKGLSGRRDPTPGQLSLF
jgi:hypothetical protein